MSKFFIQAVAAAVAISAAVPAVAHQVISAPGTSLTAAAQEKFNRDSDGDNQQWMVTEPGMSAEAARRHLAAAAGLTLEQARGMSVSDLFVAKINRESRSDEQVTPRATATMSSRSPFMADRQLLAAAGLTEQQAIGLSLSEIAAAKINRDAGHDARIDG